MKKKVLKSKKKRIRVGKSNYYFPGKIFLKPGINEIIIGNYCAIGENLRVVASNHNYNLPAVLVSLYLDKFGKYPGYISKGPVTIGSDIWFGDDVIVLGGVTVGDGSIIAAGSVVTKDVPPYAIIAGVPGRVVKYRFNNNIISFLLDLKWWDWSDDRIKRNEEFFITDLTNIKSLSNLKKLIKD